MYLYVNNSVHEITEKWLKLNCIACIVCTYVTFLGHKCVCVLFSCREFLRIGLSPYNPDVSFYRCTDALLRKFVVVNHAWVSGLILDVVDIPFVFLVGYSVSIIHRSMPCHATMHLCFPSVSYGLISVSIINSFLPWIRWDCPHYCSWTWSPVSRSRSPQIEYLTIYCVMKYTFNLIPKISKILI